MKITAIELSNVRGFQKLPKTELARGVNVFIGPNNSGKSTILSAIFQLQRQGLGRNDITLGRLKGEILLDFEGKHLTYLANEASNARCKFDLNNGLRILVDAYGSKKSTIPNIPETEPLNIIYPYLSKRKTDGYSADINENNANAVIGNFTYLNSKIDRLITPQFQPGNRQYVKACEDILGFQVSSLAKGGGKQAVYFVHNLEHIPLTSMGEGVANVLGLVTDLCVAEERIFLIEEPENDIHPKALKALLNLIIEKSSSNQFFVSTHSNIVMKYLGGATESKVFYVSNSLGVQTERPGLFTSTLREVTSDPEERRQVLEELGYDFFDFDLWSCWLFLEESSAEFLIKNYFINWYVKPLANKIRTFSAGGATEIIPKFEDFDRLFVFLHLEPSYKNKVWVIIDKGDEEDKIIAKMKLKYSKSGWNADNFSQFDQHDFEKYYPARFMARVSQVLKISDKQAKRTEKKKLLEEVISWIREGEVRAKEEFQVSAKPVIDKLKQISKVMSR